MARRTKRNPRLLQEEIELIKQEIETLEQMMSSANRKQFLSKEEYEEYILDLAGEIEDGRKRLKRFEKSLGKELEQMPLDPNDFENIFERYDFEEESEDDMREMLGLAPRRRGSRRGGRQQETAFKQRKKNPTRKNPLTAASIPVIAAALGFYLGKK